LSAFNALLGKIVVSVVSNDLSQVLPADAAAFKAYSQVLSAERRFHLAEGLQKVEKVVKALLLRQTRELCLIKLGQLLNKINEVWLSLSNFAKAHVFEEFAHIGNVLGLQLDRRSSGTSEKEL